MLKVVGASWQKTRIGTYILIGAGLLVIGAFFISYMDRPKYNGTYCATAFWSKQTGFHIEYWKQQNDLLNIPKGAARVCYKDSIYENGWAQIEVETQRTYPDWVQAFGAGILEGSLTWNNIYNQWKNTIESSCERDESSQAFCTWLRELLTENYIRIKETAVQRGEHDHYWHQISLYFSQMEGLETGYIRGASRARSDLEEEIPFSDFLLLNAAADIQDLKIYFENFVAKANNTTNTAAEGTENGNENGEQEAAATAEAAAQQTESAGPKNFFLPSATMLTKIFQTADSPTWRLLFGHSTAGSYASMLRIQKRYKFHYHFSPNQRSNTVPGVDITFTGYPGILGSTDDFYIVKGRQVQSIVGGVGIKNENIDLWKTVNVTQALPLAARVMAANRIAQNRRTWAKAMSRHPYTGCKQWITVDLNKLRPQDNLYTKLAEDEKHDDAALPLNAADEAAINERHNRNKGLVWIVEQLPGRMHLKDVSEKFLTGTNSTWIANGVPYFDEMLQASGVMAADTTDLIAPQVLDEELTTLEAVDQFMRKHGFRGDLLGEESIAYGNIDIKLFSYNAQIGISDYHAFAGPIFIRLQHVQPREAAALESAASIVSSTDDAAISDSDSSNGGDKPKDLASHLKDERLSVSIDDAAQLAELERITERRSVRNDMHAIVMRQYSSGPFKWSGIADYMRDDVEHQGHPDEFNFGKVSPSWAW